MTSAVHFVNTVLCVAKCVRRCRKSDGVLRPFRRRTTNAEPHPFALWRRIPWAAPSSPSPDRRSSRLLGDVAELRTGRDASDALMTRHRNPETRTSWWRLECEVDDSVYNIARLSGDVTMTYHDPVLGGREAALRWVSTELLRESFLRNQTVMQNKHEIISRTLYVL